MQISVPYSSLLPRLAEPQGGEQSVTQYFGISGGLGVAYGNNIWVTCGNGGPSNLGYSEDGITWLPGTNLFNTAYSVAYGNGKWMAVGHGFYGTIAQSTDGKTWTPVSTNFFAGGEGMGIAYGGNNNWVAVGHGNQGTIGYSTDNGQTWTASTNFFGTGRGRGVAYGNGIWVAVGGGENGNICYSNDGGMTFNLSEPFFETGEGWGVTFGKRNGLNGWMTVGGNSEGTRSIAFSANAVNWTPLDNFFTGGIGKSVAYDPINDMWVAVGYGRRGTIGYSTDGGTTFIAANSLFNSGGGGYAVGFSSSTQAWVVVGGGTDENVTVGYSSNGKYFTTTVVTVVGGVAPRYFRLLRFLDRQ